MFCDQGDITNIELPNTALKGTLPLPELANLTAMRKFDMSQNSLTGTLPGELGDAWAHSLEAFAVSSNYFTGELPSSFAKCRKMMDFRVNNNNITGNLQDEFGNGWGGSLASFAVSNNTIA